jgi:tetratricopeptide (TPR) repeat protein
LIHGGNASLGDTRNLEALAKFADAQAAYQAFTPHGNLAARTLYREAVAIDPSFARALVGVANTHLIEMFEAPAEDWAGQINTISRLSERAARQAPGLPELYKLRSMLALARGDQDLALAEAEAMVTLDPNGAESHYTLGQMLFFAGHYGRAIENLRVAERLNPNRRASYSSHLAFALLAEGKIDAAVRVLQEVREKWPDYVPGSAYLAIAYQLSGREGDARGTARLSNGDGAATFSMRAIERRFAPMRDRALARRLIDAARAAGIPDCCGLDPD